MHKFTPGVITFGTGVAQGMAYTAAVNGFWAGPWAGSLYYGLVGVSAPPWMLVGVFSGLLIPIAALGAFAGVLADPLQKKLGVHEKRLQALLDSVETNLKGEGNTRMPVRDHYLARIFDLLDWTQAALHAAL
jgi:hypothetical protein